MQTAHGDDLYRAAHWFRPGQGPRYQQLHRHLAGTIGDGTLPPGAQLPPERDLADLAEVSRVTVRKAVAQLALDGLIEQRQGAGSFVRRPAERIEQSLSGLTSFTEYMQLRGKVSTSRVLEAGHFGPSPDETIALGIPAHERVSRVERLRAADGVSMALERSTLPRDILPDPGAVTTSLYTVLRARAAVPSRAIQRITAVSLGPKEAQLLDLPEGAPVLRIDRTAYLPSGRPVEFTRGLYRSDIYDFVAELRLDPV